MSLQKLKERIYARVGRESPYTLAHKAERVVDIAVEETLKEIFRELDKEDTGDGSVLMFEKSYRRLKRRWGVRVGKLKSY